MNDCIAKPLHMGELLVKTTQWGAQRPAPTPEGRVGDSPEDEGP